MPAFGDTRPDMPELEVTDTGSAALPTAPKHCVVLTGVRRVLLDGQEVRLGGRAFDLLLALHARHGHVVPKQDLQDAIWPGVAVMPNNLDVQVWALRRCLGQDAISTVARRGYALTHALDITVVRPQEDSTASGGLSVPGAPPDLSRFQATALVQQLAGTGQLLLAGASVEARLRLCDAVCRAYSQSLQAMVWRMQAQGMTDLQQLESHVLRLQRAGGLAVFVEAAPTLRGSVYAWQRATAGGRRLRVLATAAQVDPGVDAGVTVATPLADSDAPAPVQPLPRPLRWQPRPQPGVG